MGRDTDVRFGPHEEALHAIANALESDSNSLDLIATAIQDQDIHDGLGDIAKAIEDHNE